MSKPRYLKPSRVMAAAALSVATGSAVASVPAKVPGHRVNALQDLVRHVAAYRNSRLILARPRNTEPRLRFAMHYSHVSHSSHSSHYSHYSSS